jgi:hypothetical protein
VRRPRQSKRWLLMILGTESRWRVERWGETTTLDRLTITPISRLCTLTLKEIERRIRDLCY